MSILSLIEKVVVILFLMGIGYILNRKGIVKEKDTKVLSDIIVTVFVPALVFHSMLETYTKEMLFNSYTIILFSILMSFISFLIALIAIRSFKDIKKDKRDIFILSCILSNTVFIGLPVVVSLYGDQASGLVFIFDIGAFMILWSFGIYLVNKQAGVNIKEMFKQLINMPFIIFIITGLLIILEIKPPHIIMEVADMLGRGTIPLSMLLIGMNVAVLEFDYKKIDYNIMIIVLIRLILVPVIMILIMLPFDISLLFKKVIIIESALPTMLTTAILARKYNKEYQYATTAVFLTTTLCIMTLPLIAYLTEIVLGG